MIHLANLPGTWRFEARCDPDNADFWFPTVGMNPAAIKAECQRCPVIEQCRAYGLEHEDVVGVWGGLTDAERRAKRKEKTA